MKHASSNQTISGRGANTSSAVSFTDDQLSHGCVPHAFDGKPVFDAVVVSDLNSSAQPVSKIWLNREQPGRSLSKPIDVSSCISKNQRHKSISSSRDDSAVAGSESEISDTRCFLLWIDGVGVWQLLMGNRFVIGAPSSKGPEADLAIQANVRKQHVAICSDRDEWLLDPLADTFIANQPIATKTHLQSGDQIRLGESVELGFRLPSPLSHSAILDFESSHRPLQSVDGVILLTDHCIVGPRRDQHIYCSTWQHSFVLFRRDDKLLCRSSGDFQFNGTDIEDVCEITEDSMIESEHCRFRIEVIR